MTHDNRRAWGASPGPTRKTGLEASERCLITLHERIDYPEVLAVVVGAAHRAKLVSLPPPVPLSTFFEQVVERVDTRVPIGVWGGVRGTRYLSSDL